MNDLLMQWLGLFTAPFKNLEMLWIIIPIYLSWILTELYQEKKGTSLGNAISNGVIVLWVGIDWARQTVNSYMGKVLEWGFFTKMGLAVLMFLYGLWVIKIGIATKKSTHIFGRIRVITYILLVFTPLFYGTVAFSWTILLAILIFAPVFYIVVEIIDRLTPNPKVYEEDESFGAGISKGAGLKDLGKEPAFGAKGKLDQGLPGPLAGGGTDLGAGFGSDFGASPTSPFDTGFGQSTSLPGSKKAGKLGKGKGF